MTAVAVPCWTIVCDFCGQDAAEGGEYSGMGPGPGEAREAFCEEWTTWRDLDICTDCYSGEVTCESCSEAEAGWAGNCIGCWESAS